MNQRSNKTPFFLLCTYFLLEYGRPQSLIPGLDLLHLPLITLVVIALYLLNRLRYDVRQFKIFIAFLVLMAVHVPFAVNNYWAFQTTYTVFLYLIAFCGMVFMTSTIVEIQKLLKFLTITLLILAVVGIWHHGRIPYSSFLGDENDFALAMNVAFSLLFFQNLNAKSAKARVFYVVMMCVTLMANVLTASRGGFVGFIPVAVYCWTRLKRKVLSTILCLIVLAGVAYFAPVQYWEEITTLSQGTEESTADLRMYYWKMGWKMFLSNPVIGVGPGNYPWRISEFEPPEGHIGRSHASRPAHSLYLTLLPELGIVGVGLYFMMILAFLRSRKYVLLTCNESPHLLASSGVQPEVIRNAMYSIDGAMISYFSTGAFLSVLYYPYFWTFIGLTTAFHIRIMDLSKIAITDPIKGAEVRKV